MAGAAAVRAGRPPGAGERRTTVIAEAVAAARAADVAVVVVGLTEEQETEAVDKTTLRLPGAQDALVSAVAAAARRTVVVVNAATPVLMPWLAEVDAVLWAGLPGQEGGHAVAAALLGDIEPAGRLVTTFPAADGAAPAWSVTPGRRRRLDLRRGHRSSATAGTTPARAPAAGVLVRARRSGYSDLGRTRTPAVGLGRRLAGRDASTVTNTGSRASREVVQVYLEPAATDQPVRLVGWTAVTAEPGETVPVRVTRTPAWAPLDRRRLGPPPTRRPPPGRPRPRRHPHNPQPLAET